MAELAVQVISISAPLAPAYSAAAAGGDLFKPQLSWEGAVIVHVKNAGVGSVTITVDDPTSVSPVGATAFNPDYQVSVPAGAERMFPVKPLARFTGVTGDVNITYSGVTSVTVAVLRVA